jgi:hypothetical protein
MLIPFMMLAIESSGVVLLRTAKLMSGDSDTIHEAHLMVSEKIDAAFEAISSLLAGASSDEIVHRYRQYVAVNAKRLGKSRAIHPRSDGRECVQFSERIATPAHPCVYQKLKPGRNGDEARRVSGVNE